MTKRFSDCREELLRREPRAHVESEEGRRGLPTAKVGGVLLHSSYNPEEEARRLIDAAGLDPARPVLVVGLGLGYHVEELLRRHFDAAAVEPDPDVAALAARRLPEDLSFLLVAGDLDEALEDETFAAWLRAEPQVFVHPPTARLHPAYADAAAQLPARAALRSARLNIAVVGAMYGGSVPISGYLVDALQRLGHNALHLDNSLVWPVYDAARSSLKSEKAAGQLTEMLTQFMSEWNYARAAEFNPEICIVLAQAPVLPAFPERLRKHGIVSAYWYVENWRHMPYWRAIAPLYDYFFHIQPGEFEKRLDEIGCRRHAFIQTGCDPEKHRPVALEAEEREVYDCDIAFAGAGYPNRIAFFTGLTDYRFKLWGVNWANRHLAPLVVGGEQRFDNETFMKIVAGSRINLNLHSSTMHESVDPRCDAVNPRVFEIAAAGGFQVCDPCIGLESHFDFKTELPTYRSIKELRALIDHYLAHPEERRAVAEQARARALREHAYEHRARHMLSEILARHGEHIRGRGVRVQRTVGETAARLDQDDALALWLNTLDENMMFTAENIEAALAPAMMKRLSHPEKVFAYLREVRDFAEKMLKERR